MSAKQAGRRISGTMLLAALLAGPVLAQVDVTRPADVTQLLLDKSGSDVELVWNAVALDAAGMPETLASYNVYRGGSPTYVADKAAFSNRVGTPVSESFADVGAAGDTNPYFYLISATDASGNEGNTKAPLVTTTPVLSGFWTDSTIETDWTGADPQAEIVYYNVYRARKSGTYRTQDDVGLSTSYSIGGIKREVNWYFAVTAVDTNGNETPFSNEHVDALGGVVTVQAHDEEELCWGSGNCTPNAGTIQRNNGFQALVPVEFPEGDWVSVTVTLTMESRLCTPPANGTLTKCGSGNPCPEPPCNGGFNPCGDPWDRSAHLWMVLDDCIGTGGNCRTNNNLELISAVTPFGTDAEPTDGTGFVPPRELTLDITPYTPLLTGERYIGAEIVHFVQKGWWVTVKFRFSERPEDTSPDPPADGIEVVGYAGAPLATKQISIPATATDVKARLFTTGHGGLLFCDGGSNDANPCTVNGGTAECPGGGVCNPCDEFCHRTNRIIVDGSPVWEVEPWRNDCNLPPTQPCFLWNACGTGSCIFPRAGWCPGYIACHHNAPCDNDLDMLGDLVPGGTYDIDYDVVPQNGSWAISLVVYWYE